MTAAINVLHPSKPKRVLILVSNSGVSPQTGWPVGFWWAELTHPYWEFVERGYQVDIASPDVGELHWDSWSDPRDESGYSANDLISLGFINSPKHFELIQNARALDQVKITDYDVLFVVGGQAPMVTFFSDTRVHQFVTDFYELGKVTALVCHATCVLLKARQSDGSLIVAGKTWTGFADAEEQYADNFVGKRIQPFWIEEEARKLDNTNFIVNSPFKAHAVRDGHLITGQQQYSGASA